MFSNIKYFFYKIYDFFTFRILQQLRFYETIDKAFERSPNSAYFYQFARLLLLNDMWKLGIKSYEDFQKLPLTTKKDLADSPRKNTKYHTHETSGSTGEPRVIFVPKQTWYRKDAIFVRSWNRMGRKKGDKVLRLIAGEPKYKFYDWLRNVYPMNYRTIGKKHVDFVVKHRPKIIHGPGGSIRQLCEEVIRAGHADVLNDVIISWAGENSKGHKERLTQFVKGFHEQYGLAELPTVASPDGLGNMRVCEETGIIEIINDSGKLCKENEEGNIVVTDFYNDVMPIVRYVTGDRGKVKFIKNKVLDISYPVLYDIKGRGVDYYYEKGVTKRALGWWVVSPLSHNYKDVISKWRFEIYPRLKEVKLLVVPATDSLKEIQFRDAWFDWRMSEYISWFKKETGLDCKVEVVDNMDGWKNDLVRIIN